jgi:two-component system response regulator FixJ
MAQTVYVVDDDPAMRDLIEVGLRRLGCQVRAYASAEALLAAGLFSPVQAVGADTEASCLLLDLEMPGTSGLELLEKIRQVAAAAPRFRPPCPVIVITARGSVESAVTSMKLGAVDFFEKPFEIDALVKLVRETLERHQGRLAAARETEAARERIGSLSARERELLDSIVQGRSTKMIADALGISARTVDHHRANLMEKMKAENVADLVRMAVEADYKSA